jgi:hypothetical protein
MKDYFKATEFILDFLYFYYLGNRYQGRGIMTWKPEEGFQLEAFLDGKGKQFEKIEIGKVKIHSKKDISSIRIRPQGYDWAVIPDILFSGWDKHNIQNNRLSIRFSRVIFCESVNPASADNLWTGNALYETNSKLLLFDSVKTETRINDQEIEWKEEASGIFFEDNSQRKIIGHMVDERNLKIYWKLPKLLWSKSEAWKSSIAIQDVLSIFFGEKIWLLQREFIRDVQKITEIRQKIKLSTLALLSSFGNFSLDKQDFINLIDFFIRSPQLSEVCRNIFLQLIEASKQHSRQAQELILSTILEASLRTIEGRPFTAKKDKSWNVGKGLEKFFNDYLPSQEWETVRHQVMKAHCYLRDRNAHPDWLFSEGGGFSTEEQTKSLDSMILLSRFYGYMTLALAEFKDLRPLFPTPHQTWNAAATITAAPNFNSENTFYDLDMLVEEMSGLNKLSNKLSEAKTMHEKTMIWRNFKRNI